MKQQSELKARLEAFEEIESQYMLFSSKEFEDYLGIIVSELKYILEELE